MSFIFFCLKIKQSLIIIYWSSKAKARFQEEFYFRLIGTEIKNSKYPKQNFFGTLNSKKPKNFKKQIKKS